MRNKYVGSVGFKSSALILPNPTFILKFIPLRGLAIANFRIILP